MKMLDLCCRTNIAKVAIASLVTITAAQSMAEDKRYGGELTLVASHTDAHVRNFNPYNYSVGSYHSQDFIYEPLWVYNIANPGKDFPRLATSFEVAKDLLSVTYQLREGVKWSDGETFNADDVIFTVDLAKAHPDYPVGLDFQKPDNPGGLLKHVVKNSDYSVTFHLSKPSALAHEKIGRIYPLPEHIWRKVDNPSTFTNESPVGTGPFTEVESFRVSQFKLCKNPNYYVNKAPYIQCLKFPQYSGNDQTAVAAARGKIDWMGEGMTDPEKTYANKHEGNKYWLPAGGNTNLQLNTRKAPFNDLAFRQAMSIAIDRPTILEVATFGLTTATKYPIGTGEFYKGWYNANSLKSYEYLMEYNPTRAAQILEKAGYKDRDNDGWRELTNGEPLAFNLSVPSGWTDWVNTMMTISENLQDVGIQANLHTPDDTSWFATIEEGDFDVYIMWIHQYVTPHGTYADMFNPEAMKDGQRSAQTMHGMDIPEINALLDKFAQTPELAKQRQYIDQVHQLVAENLPVISLFANPDWYQYNDSRFEGWVTPDNPYVRPMVHQGIPERLIHVLNLSLKHGIAAK